MKYVVGNRASNYSDSQDTDDKIIVLPSIVYNIRNKKIRHSELIEEILRPFSKLVQILRQAVLNGRDNNVNTLLFLNCQNQQRVEHRR